VQLIASIHESVLLNVEQAQKKQRNTYANRPGKHLFEGLVAGKSMVKMKKPGKRRALIASWEGPYQFVRHADGKGNFDFEEGCRICIGQDADGRQWERLRRDLQIYYAPSDWAEGLSFFKKGGVTYVAEQRVAGQWLHDCAVCVNTKTLIRVIWPPRLMSGSGFLLH